MASTLYTTDFRRAFEADTTSLLRRRFLWFAGTMAALVLVTGGIAAAVRISGGTLGDGLSLAQGADRRLVAGVIGRALLLGVYAVSMWLVWSRRVVAGKLLGLTYRAVVAHGLVELAMLYAVERGEASLLGTLWQIGVVHLFAASFLPWTPGQALRPVGVLLGVNALGLIAIADRSLGGTALTIALSPLIGVPGVAVCWVRQSRRVRDVKLRFLQRRYGEVRRELVDARKIHESLFPPMIADGPVRFSYVYEPMHLIGGDYLHAWAPPGDRDGWAPLSVVLMDVTGHGIPAALTVNRLHGELSRLFAENGDAGPGHVLASLNRYVHLTLATHSVYVTALCVRVDPKGDRLEYASGGHPPAFIRGVDGTLQELESTSFVLGAVGCEAFDGDAREVPFSPGDALVAYTDGATEARNRMLGVDGVRRTIITQPAREAQRWPERILELVDTHRLGPPADDTLIVAISRPLISEVWADLSDSRARRVAAQAG